MADTKSQSTSESTTHEPQTAEERRVHEATEKQKSDSLSPQQKYENYLKDVERIHSEP